MACVAGFQTQEWRGRKSGGDACRKDQPWTVLPGGLAIRRGEQSLKRALSGEGEGLPLGKGLRGPGGRVHGLGDNSKSSQCMNQSTQSHETGCRV